MSRTAEGGKPEAMVERGAKQFNLTAWKVNCLRQVKVKTDLWRKRDMYVPQLLK